VAEKLKDEELGRGVREEDNRTPARLPATLWPEGEHFFSLLVGIY